MFVADTKKIKELKAKHEAIIKKENKKIESYVFDFVNSLMDHVAKDDELSKDLISFFEERKLEKLNVKYQKILEVYQ